MSLKPNDRIKLDGKEVTIVSRHAAGKHVRFHLSDGRTMLDLDDNPTVVPLNRVPVVSEEETAEMDCPFPPEPGYEEVTDAEEEEAAPDTDR